LAVTVKAASPQGQDPIKNRDRYPFTPWRSARACTNTPGPARTALPPGSASRCRRPHRRPGERARVDTTGVWVAFAGCPTSSPRPDRPRPRWCPCSCARWSGRCHGTMVPMVLDYHGC